MSGCSPTVGCGTVISGVREHSSGTDWTNWRLARPSERDALARLTRNSQPLAQELISIGRI